MNIKNIDGYEFLEFKEKNANIYFSTAKNNLDFNKNISEGKENLNKLKLWFQLDDVGYSNQIHSDVVNTYDEQISDGDALIADKRNIAIGIFTADCVPVLIYDKSKEIIAAIHSGWKGTIKSIVKKTIEKMALDYNSMAEDLVVYIGPHNMECCYKVSEELINEFKNKEMYKNINISSGRNLSLQNCILKQLLDSGVKEDKINTLNICTYCNDEYSLYSYRKAKKGYGRMFSFIFIK